MRRSTTFDSVGHHRGGLDLDPGPILDQIGHLDQGHHRAVAVDHRLMGLTQFFALGQLLFFVFHIPGLIKDAKVTLDT